MANMYRIHGNLASKTTSISWDVDEFQEADTALEALYLLLKDNEEFDFPDKTIKVCSETSRNRWAEIRDQDFEHRIIAIIEEEKCLT